MDGGEALSILEAADRKPPVRWWLTGPDTYQVDQIVRAIRQRLGPEATRETVDGAQDPAALALRLGTQGFLDAPRLLIWQNPDAKSLKRDGFRDLVAASASDAWLVIWSEKQKPPNPADFTTVAVEYLRGAQWTAFVQREARRRNLRLDRETLTYVAEACRPYGHYLNQSLDKLALAQKGGVALTATTVSGLVTPVGDDALYPLTDALLRRDLAKAWSELTRHLAGGLAPPVVLAVVARPMIVLEEWLAEGRGEDLEGFLARHGQRPWQARLYRTAERVWSLAAVQRWVDRAARVDHHLKHSVGDPHVWLASLVLGGAP